MESYPVIAIVGGLNMDFVFETDRIPDLGESKDAISSGQYHGGKGANTAVAAVRASHVRPKEGLRPTPTDTTSEVKIYFNSAVGKDSLGPVLVKELEKKGVDVTGIQEHETEPSGTCVVLVEIDRGGESRNISYPGAYMRWRPSESNSVRCLAAGHRPDLVMVSLNQPRDVVEEILFSAYNTGVPTLLNHSPPYYLSSHIYEAVTHLIMNESEAALLTDTELMELQNLSSWQKAASYFLELGVPNVVITLGKKGAFFATADGKQGLVEAVPDVKVADSTGAGDTFNGNYAVEFVEQMRQGQFDIEKAISRACKAAALTIEQLGCQESIPWKDDLVISTDTNLANQPDIVEPSIPAPG